MEYGKIVTRSANIVWQNKFLIAVGILASLGSGLTPGSSGSGSDTSGISGFGDLEPFEAEIAGLVIGVVFAFICLALLIGIAIWVVSTIARGGLIASVDSIESGEKSSFRQSWSAGWQRVWTLLGIGILPAIPVLLLFVVGLLALGSFGGFFALFGDEFDPVIGWTGLGTVMALAACILIPIMLILSILRNFAERACMLEDLGTIDAYRRGTSVLMANLGEAIILFLLQIALFIGVGIVLFVPGLIALACCCLWPLLLVVHGFVEAFLSTLWTLAWRTWTGEPPMVEKAPAAA